MHKFIYIATTTLAMSTATVFASTVIGDSNLDDFIDSIARTKFSMDEQIIRLGGNPLEVKKENVTLNMAYNNHYAKKMFEEGKSLIIGKAKEIQNIQEDYKKKIDACCISLFKERNSGLKSPTGVNSIETSPASSLQENSFLNTLLMQRDTLENRDSNYTSDADEEMISANQTCVDDAPEQIKSNIIPSLSPAKKVIPSILSMLIHQKAQTRIISHVLH